MPSQTGMRCMGCGWRRCVVAGWVQVLHTWQLVVQRKRPKAHKVFCTAVAFSPDSKHVLSASGDASATLTATAPEPSKVPPFGK